jgi:hypothetical protein
LICGTPHFWSKFVLLKLQYDFDGAYRFPATPNPNGANSYFGAIEANLAKLKRS